MDIDNLFQNLLQSLFADMEVNLQLKGVFRDTSVHKTQILRKDFIKDKTAQGRFHHVGSFRSVSQFFRNFNLDSGMKGKNMVFICQYGFIQALEVFSFSHCPGSFLCQVVNTQYHILGRNGNRSAVGRLQQVIGGKEHKTAFRLRFHGKRKMHGHLVTVEVRIECGTYQGVKLNRLTFHQNRLKGLDTEPVQGRGTVQHNGMFFDNILQDVPNLGIQSFHQFLCIFNVLGNSSCHQLLHNKGLEQLDSHFLGQAALVNFQFRPHYDNTSPGVVNTLAQQVLTETSGFPLQHVGKGLQRPVSGACYRMASSAVVDKGIHRFLEHSLFVSDNDIRSTQLQQSFQTVISVNNPAVQIIQVGGGKAPAVQLYHRTQIRRNNRNSIQNHPFGTVSGLPESLHNLQALNDSGAFLAGGFIQSCFQFFRFLFQVNCFQQLFDGLSTHPCTEFISPGFSCILEFLLGKHLLVFQIALARIQHDIRSEIKYLFQHSGGKIQNQPHTAGDTFKIPDMGNRRRQFNMSHTLTADA